MGTTGRRGCQRAASIASDHRYRLPHGYERPASNCSPWPRLGAWMWRDRNAPYPRPAARRRSLACHDLGRQAGDAPLLGDFDLVAGLALLGRDALPGLPLRPVARVRGLEL